MDPQPGALMQKKGGVRVTALLATARGADEVRAAFDGIPEIENVDVRLAPPANGPAREAEPPPPPRAVRAVPESAAPEIRAEATVRVRAQALDQLLDQASDILHGIARLREAARQLPENAAAPFEAEIDRLRRTARELHGGVMTARLTPFSSLTEHLPRAIRDLAHRLGKEVELEVQGGEVELDRTVIEALSDPLTHLVRNAVDHGLETSAHRVSLGKSPRGLLVLAARRERDKVLVEVSDDGARLRRGPPAQAGHRPGRAAGAPGRRAERAAELRAGLPPRALHPRGGDGPLRPRSGARCGEVGDRGDGREDRAPLGAGKGIALHAGAAAERLDGESAPGAGGRRAVRPADDPRRRHHRVRFSRPAAAKDSRRRSLAVMGQLVRAYSLAKLFGLPSLAPPGPRPFAVLEVDGLTFALSVDRLVGQEEAVLKPLFPPIDRIKGLAGTTVLGNGRPLLVLDPRGLHELAEAAQRVRGAA